MSQRNKILVAKILLFLAVFFNSLASSTSTVNAGLFPADKCTPDIFRAVSVNGSEIYHGTIPTIDVPTTTISIKFNDAQTNTTNYRVKLFSGSTSGGEEKSSNVFSISQSQGASVDLIIDTLDPAMYGTGAQQSMDLKLYAVDSNGKESELCQIADINMNAYQIICDGIQITQSRPVAQSDGSTSVLDCKFNLGDIGNQCIETNSSDTKPINIKLVGLRYSMGDAVPKGTEIGLNFPKEGTAALREFAKVAYDKTVTFGPLRAADKSSYRIDLTNNNIPLGGGCQSKTVDVTAGCKPNQCSSFVSPIAPYDPATSSPIYSVSFELCAQASDEPTNGGKSSQQECRECLSAGIDGNSPKGIWTAVGCIKTEPKAIVESVVQIGVGVGGGIALLMTLIGGFLLTTSQGDPKRTQEGKDMITSSVIGIIFVLFSVVVLQFVGVTVLRLPGFGVS